VKNEHTTDEEKVFDLALSGSATKLAHEDLNSGCSAVNYMAVFY
jgi:hypothetical protein